MWVGAQARKPGTGKDLSNAEWVWGDDSDFTLPYKWQARYIILLYATSIYGNEHKHFSSSLLLLIFSAFCRNKDCLMVQPDNGKPLYAFRCDYKTAYICEYPNDEPAGKF